MDKDKKGSKRIKKPCPDFGRWAGHKKAMKTKTSLINLFTAFQLILQFLQFVPIAFGG